MLNVWPLKLKLDVEKSKQTSFGWAKWFWPYISAEVEHILTPDREESVMNVITMVLPGSDSLIIMIGPGGLLLVVSHLYALPALVLRVGLEKSK